MRDLLKCVLIILFIAMCMSSYEEDKESHYTTILVEDDMKYLNSHMTINDGVDISASSRVEAEIQYLPTKLWKRYLYENGKLIISSEVVTVDDIDIVGSFSAINEVYLTITVNEDYIEYSLCHEFSHYLFHIEDATSYWGYVDMLSEKESIWKEYMSCNEYFLSENEYFAEAGKLYFKGLLDAERYPKTIEFFDHLTEKYR